MLDARYLPFGWFYIMCSCARMCLHQSCFLWSIYNWKQGVAGRKPTLHHYTHRPTHTPWCPVVNWGCAQCWVWRHWPWPYGTKQSGSFCARGPRWEESHCTYKKTEEEEHGDKSDVSGAPFISATPVEVIGESDSADCSPDVENNGNTRGQVVVCNLQLPC